EGGGVGGGGGGGEGGGGAFFCPPGREGGGWRAGRAGWGGARPIESHRAPHPGPLHAGRACPTCALMMPNSGKPEFGGEREKKLTPPGSAARRPRRGRAHCRPAPTRLLLPRVPRPRSAPSSPRPC